MQKIDFDPAAGIVKELDMLLKHGNAHASFEDAINDIPVKSLSAVPGGLPYSIWQLVEHIRITQWDILEFSRDPNHKSPSWPDEYWPKEKAPSDTETWRKSLDQIEKDKKAFIALLRAAGPEMYKPFPYGDGQSLFREALVLADHNSYHTAEIIVIRRLMGEWKK